MLGAYTVRVSAWVQYSLIRVGLFAVVLAALLVLGLEPWISALAAAIIGLCVSYIFFAPLRSKVTADLANRRGRAPVDADADVEDR
jgi:uncharacterized membrane protein YphA (DoxX/SURF4 family)